MGELEMSVKSKMNESRERTQETRCTIARTERHVYRLRQEGRLGHEERT